MPSHSITPVLIAGGGPAGIALLLAASRHGELPRLLDEGLTLVEQGNHIGSGMLGRYVINSDSAAETFVDVLADNPVPELAQLCTHPLVEHIRSHGKQTLPLRTVAEYLDLVGHVLAALIRRHPASRLLTGWRLTSLRHGDRGGWSACLVSTDGAQTQHVTARRVVLALGANQPEQRLHNEPVGGRPLLPYCQGRLMQSDDLLSPTGISRLRAMVAGAGKPRIAIVGGASSALSVARVILRDMKELIAPGHLALLHKSRLKLFYRTAEEALADGYTDFGPADICPISQFVYRFGGLRYDSRDLAMRLMGVANAPPESRLQTIQMTNSNEGQVRAVLDSADAVIACLGYRPRRMAIMDRYNRFIPLATDHPQGNLTGADCAILDEAGRAIPGLFGLGLAAGYSPATTMGGERSFTGQVNSLWLWQNAIGEKILYQLLPEEAPLPRIAVARSPAISAHQGIHH